MKNNIKQDNIKIVEHPELRWWWNAITLNAHNANISYIYKNKQWGKSK